MNEIYSEQHRVMQNQFDTEKLADRLNDIIVTPELDDDRKGFIESRDLFFLTTVDHRGYPTCSYKGGSPGFVKVLDSKTLAFPSFDGNGMFLSMGNILGNNKIGMLFIDFESPHRIRIHGTASIDLNDPLLAEFNGAELIVRVAITESFVNCPRYIHKYQRVDTSKYVPQSGCPTPPAPQWKRINDIQDVLPERDKNTADALGGAITPEEYGAILRKREG
jgi:predicted pyridoxine 5'-phosphate oxidase superfamily flavin-nucleotide-binding protein